MMRIAALAMMVGVLVQAGAVAQERRKSETPPAGDDAEVQFIERLNEYVQTYLSDAPAQARDFQDAVRQFQTEQAAVLLKSLNLPARPGPLTPEQQQALEKIETLYRDTESARIAAERLREHFRILDEPKAQEALKAIQIQGDELTAEQLTALTQLRDQFPQSEAARKAAATVARHRQLEADRGLQKLIKEYMRTPGAQEAIERYLERRLTSALTLVEPQQVVRLEDIIRNFPDSSAAVRAKAMLMAINERTAQRDANSASAAARSAWYRGYWDRIYPSRLVPPTPARPPLRESEGKSPSTYTPLP